jgi:hypothetical protein
LGRAPAHPASPIYSRQAQLNVIKASEPGSKETSTRRVGVATGYPPVGAAHCAPARTLRLPHVFSRNSNTFFKTGAASSLKVLKKALKPRSCENVTQIHPV